MFKLEFHTDSAIFEDYGQLECARILKQISKDVALGSNMGTIKDINGNTIGSWICTID